MSYISKQQRSAAQWIHFREALHLISTEVGGNVEAAWSQICAAISDGELRWRWERQPELKKLSVPTSLKSSSIKGMSGQITAELNRFRFASAWRTALADFETGKIYLPSLQQDREFCDILFFREDVFKHWAPNDRPVPTKKASLMDIRDAAREVYDSYKRKGQSAPNLNESYKEIRKLLPGATKSQTQTILKKPEFSTQRTPRGRRRKAADR